MNTAGTAPTGMASARRSAARATRRAAASAAAATALVLLAPMIVQGPLFGLDLTMTDLGTFCAVQHALRDGLGLWLSPWMGNGGVLALQPAAQTFYPVRCCFWRCRWTGATPCTRWRTWLREPRPRRGWRAPSALDRASPWRPASPSRSPDRRST
jgi:hypothetical protein